LVDEITPHADAVVRAELRQGLLDARERFRLAYQALRPYPEWGRFDHAVSRAYCQVLQRAGQLYDAHIEAAMALREPNLPLGLMRDLLEVQANCSLAIGDYAQAADRYAQILQAYVDAGSDRIPYHLAWAQYALRAKAEQWDWILGHVEADAETFGNDAVLRWARAAALAASGRGEEARAELAEPFNAVALGTVSFTPPSLRAHPDRRREIAMLAHRLFSEVGDSRADVALDALLAQAPDDPVALRLHADAGLAAGDLDGALSDAFALVARDARNHADFQLWLDVSDRISERRHGAPLRKRARAKVSEFHASREDRTESTVEEFRILGLAQLEKLVPLPEDPLYFVSDPAFTLSIVEELVAGGDVERAVVRMRKLVEQFPEAQELRFRLGLLLVRAGLYQPALEKFEELLEAVPDDAEALDLAMRINLALGQRTAAAELLDRMILDDPLGVGTVRHGQRLVEEGHAEEAVKLIERIGRWTKLGDRTDVLILAARAQLALGETDSAQTILQNLSSREGQSLPVALLALDLGLALDRSGLVDSAVESIRPLLPELLPDQMEEIARRLQDAGRTSDLVSLFAPEITALPSAHPVLRAVAGALKAESQFERAELLLAELDDADSLVDRFLLLALQGRQGELAHPLRLDPAVPHNQQAAQFCLLVDSVLDGEVALVDNRPGERLGELGVAA
ncbi:MAG TPA: tetratricopeptide repeat protein, partial [Planctomycetota bacterium]|nr:tetratricopeptide repeat protein [Planctomycetota bacterium]